MKDFSGEGWTGARWPSLLYSFWRLRVTNVCVRRHRGCSLPRAACSTHSRCVPPRKGSKLAHFSDYSPSAVVCHRGRSFYLCSCPLQPLKSSGSLWSPCPFFVCLSFCPSDNVLLLSVFSSPRVQIFCCVFLFLTFFSFSPQAPGLLPHGGSDPRQGHASVEDDDRIRPGMRHHPRGKYRRCRPQRRVARYTRGVLACTYMVAITSRSAHAHGLVPREFRSNLDEYWLLKVGR